MSIEIKKLIIMANQIGDFFEVNTNEELAKKDIADHLDKFWNSVMIKVIVAHVQQGGGTGLHPRVEDAIKQYIT